MVSAAVRHWQRHLQRLPSLLQGLLQGHSPETSDGFTIGKCGCNDNCGLVMWSSRCGWGVGCDGHHRYSDLVGSKTRPIVDGSAMARTTVQSPTAASACAWWRFPAMRRPWPWTRACATIGSDGERMRVSRSVGRACTNAKKLQNREFIMSRT